MKKSTLPGAALAACLVMAGGSAKAASVTLPGWAFGQGHTIGANVGDMAVSGPAGGFGGALSDAGAFDSANFLTYCIELEEQFGFGAAAMTGYRIVDGETYFSARRDASPSRPDGAQVAERLGRLLTYVDQNPSAVDSALESTAMQLAIWNIVYDADADIRMRSGGPFTAGAHTSEKHGARTNALLAGAAGVGSSRFAVYALTREGSQDFLLARGIEVPEPGSLALAGLALLGLTASGRRRAA